MKDHVTHVDILVSRIASHGAKPFFKVIRKDSTGGLTWDITTYDKLGKEIDALSAQLRTILQRDGVRDGALVGVWLNGLTYSDIVHLYALCKAGYIPNLLPTALTDSAVILGLLSKTGTQVLIHEPSLDLGTAGRQIYTYTPIDINTLVPVPPAVPVIEDRSPERIAFIQYTSGSTSNMPKVVPCTNKWLQSVYNSWESVWNPAASGEPRDIFNLPGSVNAPSGLHALLIGINLGGAFIQSTTPFFSSDELLQLSLRGGLNRLNTFAPVLCPHIQAAQRQLMNNDDTLFKVLKNMRSIVYGGMPMLPTFEKWAFENKLPIMNALGTTETGPILRCTLGEHPQHLRPFPGLELEFVARAPAEEDRLFKLAILGNSPNIPDKSLLNADGKFYTGDLFVPGEDGTWEHRGREDDWINIAAAKLVSTTIVENFIRQYCSDIVAELVVVGNGRSSLALLAEPVRPGDDQSAKDTIIERMTSFDQRRFEWEQLSADKIVFVDRGTLPRTATKGNVRRKVAEKMFEKQLDAVFATSAKAA